MAKHTINIKYFHYKKKIANTKYIYLNYNIFGT